MRTSRLPVLFPSLWLILVTVACRSNEIAELHARKAGEAFSRRNFSEAEFEASRALRAGTPSPGLILLRGKSRFFSRRFREAHEDFTALRRRGWTGALWWEARASLVDRRNREETEDLLRKAVERDPEALSAWILLGRFAELRGDARAARECADRAAALRREGLEPIAESKEPGADAPPAKRISTRR